MTPPWFSHNPKHPLKIICQKTPRTPPGFSTTVHLWMNVIAFCLSQCDHIKRLLLYYNNNNGLTGKNLFFDVLDLRNTPCILRACRHSSSKTLCGLPLTRTSEECLVPTEFSELAIFAYKDRKFILSNQFYLNPSGSSLKFCFPPPPHDMTLWQVSVSYFITKKILFYFNPFSWDEADIKK